MSMIIALVLLICIVSYLVWRANSSSGKRVHDRRQQSYRPVSKQHATEKMQHVRGKNGINFSLPASIPPAEAAAMANSMEKDLLDKMAELEKEYNAAMLRLGYSPEDIRRLEREKNSDRREALASIHRQNALDQQHESRMAVAAGLAGVVAGAALMRHHDAQDLQAHLDQAAAQARAAQAEQADAACETDDDSGSDADFDADYDDAWQDHDDDGYADDYGHDAGDDSYYGDSDSYSSNDYDDYGNNDYTDGQDYDGSDYGGDGGDGGWFDN